ncbi:RusA family crossover junction endodeoxyribonuclease [Nocardioides sp. L-11A]|uniref:RusA family crossover junction endodeoxyribonuclease n=1 Tax=Nocardioides sp. L-11A TaxID=3043848 RepID=UPI002499FE7C|nr:RusA family crossover junction endodeoxyribonuclease [Nocardioides sp. L-11A]
MTSLTINAVGTPAPAGSKRAFVVNGRARMVESSNKVRPWWQAVAGATQEALPDDWTPIAGPVRVEIVFFLARPRYHYGTGKNANRLKPTAPTYADKKPDTDKLERTVLDALKAAGVYLDDCQVVDLRGVKRYADASTGARIFVTPLRDELTSTAAGVAKVAEGALF